MKTRELSIIILNYNTSDLLEKCVKSLLKVKDEVDFKIIIVDNGSVDNSKETILSLEKSCKRYNLELKSIFLNKNLGFAAGNNKAKKYATGKNILFLNSDTEVGPGVLKKTTAFLKEKKDTAAITCKLVLANGKLDKDSRRSFPTPWVSLTHLVLKLDRVFPSSPLFAKYWYGFLPEDKTHEVDVLQGAYFLIRKSVLDKIGWFDEDYFLDGEDIDLCWRIKKAGWKLYYYPEVSTLHLKGASKGKKARFKRKVSIKEKLRFRMAGVNSMEIFYRKHLWQEYPLVVNLAVLIGIKFLKSIRFIATLLT